MKKEPLFFVHIPKTAGTSFRLAVRESVGNEYLLWDYGAQSPVTDAAIKKFMYAGNKDFWELWKYCENHDITMLSGHVGISKYAYLFGALNCITFLRDPLQRMVSEYKNRVRRDGYKGDFATFYLHPKLENRQLRILNGVPLEAIGFLGITERYNESLEVFHHSYGMELEPRQDNSHKKSDGTQYEVSEHDKEEFYRSNAQDVEFYNHAVRLFKIRRDMFEKGLPYAHAYIQEACRKRLMGWAWWADLERADQPVEVEVWVNDEKAETLNAMDLRAGMCGLRPPRAGYVGFVYSKNLASGDKVQCRVAETGQVFPPEPREVE